MLGAAESKTPAGTAAATPPDVERPAATEDSASAATANAALSALPTRLDVVCDFNGSLGFAVGSTGFILEKYHDDWLPYFRYGSIAWIWGCVGYSVPLLLKLRGGRRDGSTCPWDLGDLGLFLCCLLYTVGCVLGGFFDQEAVEAFLPAINHTFLYGSLALALEPLQQALLFVARGGSLRRRAGATKLCGTPPGGGEDAPSPPLRLLWERAFELLAMIFFIAAAVFGGFPPHPSHVLPGVYFWEVGSLCSVARSCLMLRRRRRGLAARATDE